MIKTNMDWEGIGQWRCRGGLRNSRLPPLAWGPSEDVVDPGWTPDATPWFGTLCISALSLFPAEPAPMQTHGQPVGFLI